jgi:NAD(P)-dependent dehydrogenase (short-subunit alcohol dehydrogenase family)
MGSMEGRVAVVTGGGSGLGKGAALAMAREGAAIGVLDIKAELAEATAADGRAAGGRAASAACNVGIRQALVDAVDQVSERLGGLDVMVNNAMWVRYAPISILDEKMVDRMVDTGFKSVVWGIQVAAGKMQGRGGSIVNIASAAALIGMPTALIYCGVKAGVTGLTRSAAAELGPQRIRVNAVAPGSVPTEGVRMNLTPEKIKAREARAPLKRLGAVDDIAAAVLYLASDASSFVTGQVLTVDGGVSMAYLDLAQNPA